MNRHSVLLPLLFCVLLSTFAVAADQQCGDDRPCGPVGATGLVAVIVPQEAGGADLRPACRKHDRCYEQPCADKAACDRAFLKDMQQACKCADRPIKCRITARLMYFAVKVAGKGPFEDAQRIANRGR